MKKYLAPIAGVVAAVAVTVGMAFAVPASAITNATAVAIANNYQSSVCGTGASWFCINARDPGATCDLSSGSVQWACSGGVDEENFPWLSTKDSFTQIGLSAYGNQLYASKQVIPR